MNKVAKKFDEIHTDLEANVTKIYQRRDLQTAYDLVVHSVLQFYFQGDLVRKGWCEGLVVGDTRTGKSESISRTMRHYRAGELVTGEGCSFAGLVGGLQQNQKTWSITWGKYPLNDRRSVTIDEASGLQMEDIAKMSGVRSSGVAELNKIQTEKTLARVRGFWMSNPRGKRVLAAFRSGIDAIMDLIGQPEDVARFDFGMTVASNEVPLSIINSGERPKVPHVYTSDLCNRLIMWAWSRKPEQVVFKAGSEAACLKAATWLSQRYVAPLVEGAEQRIKVARLAVAAAARVFSTSPDGESVWVFPEHVEFVTEFLDTIYKKPSMAFDLYSRAKIADREISDVKQVQARFERFGDHVRSLFESAPSFGINDIQDFSGLGREEAIEFTGFLVRTRCIQRGKFGYFNKPAFIQFLRHFKRGAQHREPGADDGELPF